MTKKQKRARAAMSRKRTGIIKAVRSLLKKTNPSAKITGARVVRLKGGGLTIRPVKANPGYMIDAFHGGGAVFKTKAQAMAYAKQLRDANRQAGNRLPVRVVKVK